MGILLNWMSFWLLGCMVHPSWAGMASSNEKVQMQCNFVRYPALCLQTVMGSRDHPVDIMSALVNKTVSETNLPNSYFEVPSSQLDVQEALRAQSITGYCRRLMSLSLKRLHQSLSALRENPKKNKHDIQTWLSAALTFNQACKDSVNNLEPWASDLAAMAHISRKMDYLSQLGSNALALVNRINGHSIGHHLTKDRKTYNDKNRRLGGQQEQDLPKWVSPKDRKLLQTNTTTEANAVVAKDGTGNYITVAEAIQAASGNRFVIYVKAGVYKEKIRTNKDGIILIGDGKYSTLIVGDDSVAGGSTLPGSATFTITGDGFIARDIGFQNTAGPQGEQALALHVASDHSVFYRCSITGYQDTLYAHALRQFYRECDIYGTLDFIFGNAAAVFQNCNLALRRPSSGGYNAILANGRSDPGQNTGFSVQNCGIMASSDLAPLKKNVKSYLGRPWKQYSRSVIMESNIDDAIQSTGWIEWPGEGSYAETLYFAEFSNTGPGAGTSYRVNWPGFHVIGPTEAEKFTVANFIAGTSWLPSTGVTFISGLQ